MYHYRECVSKGAAGARNRRSLGHHLLHPLILVLCAPADFEVQSTVIYTKYSKHCPYTVAHTLKCVCSKINHGLNHGLFISLLKLIN